MRNYQASGLRLVLGCCLLASTQAWAMSDQSLFQHARESYAAKNELALAQDSAELNAQQYILAPYSDYWLMLLRLERADNAEVQAFLTKYADLPFAERLRGEWLKKLARQQDWNQFLVQYADYKREDPIIQCYALLAKNQAGAGDVSALG